MQLQLLKNVSNHFWHLFVRYCNAVIIQNACQICPIYQYNLVLFERRRSESVENVVVLDFRWSQPRNKLVLRLVSDTHKGKTIKNLLILSGDTLGQISSSCTILRHRGHENLKLKSTKMLRPWTEPLRHLKIETQRNWYSETLRRWDSELRLWQSETLTLWDIITRTLRHKDFETLVHRVSETLKF